MNLPEAPPPPAVSVTSQITPKVLAALVCGQLGLHSAMAGLRLAAPLQALREGYNTWAVGLLLALFAAAPVLLALYSGRLADRFGYHRPVRMAVGMTALGMVLAVLSTYVKGWPHFALLCCAASLTGAGTNMAMLTIQHTAALAAGNSIERVRVFSWLGVAPAFANVLGPVTVGFVIDAGGFTWAYLAMLALPLITVVSARFVPQLPTAKLVRTATQGRAWDLLLAPGMKRLLLVNWLLSMCWDVHSFAVPILGHERGFSASTIGLILGSFTLSVSLIRMAVPMLAHRLEEVQVVCAAMMGTALVFLLYPLAATPMLMVFCALSLGITLGAVQPMIMSNLHRITPDGRHGEALAFRSMAINASSTVMPLAFGVMGTVLGAGILFWIVSGAVGSGAWVARGLRKAKT